MNLIRSPRARSAALAAFTLVEILISILILALGLLGLGVLFPVLIREQRLGADATLGVGASNNARALLSQASWGQALPPNGAIPHPALRFAEGPTAFLWDALRDPRQFQIPHPPGAITETCLGKGFDRGHGAAGMFQAYAQGEWLANLIDGPSGAMSLGFPKIAGTQTGQVNISVGPHSNQLFDGFVALSVRQRVFPMSENPTFVWDFAVQRVSSFDHARDPRYDPVRGVMFVRRIDPRIRLTGSVKTILEAITSTTLPTADQRVPVAEDENGNPTFDGIGMATGGVSPNYSPIHTAEVEFWYDGPNGTYTHRDRLYAPQLQAAVPTPSVPRRKVEWALMRQPGQKLVDNMGNIYTVVGSGNEGAFAGDVDGDGLSDYVKIDPPVPDSVTAQRASPAAAGITYLNTNGTYVNRALWQVCFTPQIPVSVTLVELAGGKGQ